MEEESAQKVAIVTGASRGIGRAIAAELARDGYYLVMNYRSNDRAAAEALDLIQKAGGRGEIMKFDVADSAAAGAAMEDINTRFSAIDVLVNNAGITADNIFLMMPEADWDSVIATTLKGFYNMTKPVLKKMLRRKKGSVVSIASVAGLIGNRGQANYSAAKAGIAAFTKSTARELGSRGITVNAIAPGFIQTAMTAALPEAVQKAFLEQIPLKRFAAPEEVAELAAFLASDGAGYITGQVIGINGGLYM